jgi:hypothetical protein
MQKIINLKNFIEKYGEKGTDSEMLYWNSQLELLDSFKAFLDPSIRSTSSKSSPRESSTEASDEDKESRDLRKSTLADMKQTERGPPAPPPPPPPMAGPPAPPPPAVEKTVAKEEKEELPITERSVDQLRDVHTKDEKRRILNEGKSRALPQNKLYDEKTDLGAQKALQSQKDNHTNMLQTLKRLLPQESERTPEQKETIKELNAKIAEIEKQLKTKKYTPITDPQLINRKIEEYTNDELAYLLDLTSQLDANTLYPIPPDAEESQISLLKTQRERTGKTLSEDAEAFGKALVGTDKLSDQVNARVASFKETEIGREFELNRGAWIEYFKNKPSTSAFREVLLKRLQTNRDSEKIKTAPFDENKAQLLEKQRVERAKKAQEASKEGGDLMSALQKGAKLKKTAEIRYVLKKLWLAPLATASKEG